MKQKQFDCVAMKHQAQERIRRELAGVTREEERVYWRRIEEEFLARRKARQSEHRQAERLTPSGGE
jgi:hypothetical protein